MQVLVRFRKHLSVFITGLIFSSILPAALAQSRLNDKDVAHLMSNLHEDVKNFRSPYESALKKSSFRKTSQEKDAKELGKQLERQTDGMLKIFQQKRKADDAFQLVAATAQKVDAVVQQLGPQSSAIPAWSRVQADLSALGPAFGITPIVSQTTSSDISCFQAVGDRRSARLVEECQQVSPSTHSPCNAQNSCKLITDEIRRGCALITSNAPAFCAEYR